jgi:hypothetical protein
MDYLFFKLWPYLALALIWGGIVGYWVCPGRNPRDGI